MINNNDETAFPQTPGIKWASERGMSLRDYFAAKAMQALLTRENLKGTAEEFARMAYKSADAMLEVRK